MAMTAEDRRFMAALIDVVSAKVDANKLVTEGGFTALKTRLDMLNGTVAKNCSDIAELRKNIVGKETYIHDRDADRQAMVGARNEAHTDAVQRALTWRAFVAPIVTGITVAILLDALHLLK